MSHEKKGVFAHTLESVDAFLGKTQVIMFTSLAKGDTLEVETRGGTYHIEILDVLKRRVRVQGGAAFPEPTETYFVGSNLTGGSLLAIHRIMPFTFLEFSGKLLPDPAERILLNGVQILPRDRVSH